MGNGSSGASQSSPSDPAREFLPSNSTELSEEPHNVFSRSIAVPLHGYDDHMELGLKRALCKLGADELPEASIVKSLRYGMIISQL